MYIYIYIDADTYIIPHVKCIINAWIRPPAWGPWGLWCLLHCKSLMCCIPSAHHCARCRGAAGAACSHWCIVST